MESEELVAREVQSLQPLDTAQALEDDGRAAHGRDRREEVARQVEVLKVLEVEHVIGQLLKIVRSQVQLFQICALVEVSYALPGELVIWKVEVFEISKVFFVQDRDLLNRVKLQVEVLKVLQIL